MKKEKLIKLSKQELLEKEKSTKVFIGIYIPIILGLFYFSLRDYFNGDEVEMPSLIIAICAVGGMVTLFPTLKAIQNELKERE